MDEIPKIKPVNTCDGTPFKGMFEVMFTNVIPPLPAVVQDSYEKDLIYNGLRKSLDVWHLDANPERYILFDGHFEYQMALKHNLPFNINLHKFESEDDVIRFLVKGTIYRVHMNAFQRAELGLEYRPILTQDGKENMSKGGKGVKISSKVDTMSDLADMVGLSHDTLRKARKIINFLAKDDDRLKQLRNGEVKIHQMHESLFGNKKDEENKSEDELFSLFAEPQDDDDQTPRIPHQKGEVVKSKFHIETESKYQFIYLEPKWDFSDAIRIPDTFLQEIQRMNIPKISNDKFSTLVVRVLSRYLNKMMNIINVWGYTCSDTICISHDSQLYNSKYTNQIHELLLVCEFNEVGVLPSYIMSQPLKSIINSEDVLPVLNDMFSNDLSKAYIFTTPQPNGDTFYYDADSNSMVSHLDKAA